jgi:hypothetical protein
MKLRPGLATPIEIVNGGLNDSSTKKSARWKEIVSTEIAIRQSAESFRRT